MIIPKKMFSKIILTIKKNKKSKMVLVLKRGLSFVCWFNPSPSPPPALRPMLVVEAKHSDKLLQYMLKSGPSSSSGPAAA